MKEKLKNIKLPNMDAKKLFTYIALVEVLIVVCIYFLVYKKYVGMTESLNSQNQVLQTRVNELKEYFDNREMYEENIETMSAEILSKLDEFPADVKEEDVLVLALDTMKEATVGYSSINISDRASYYEIPQETVANAGIENLDELIMFSNRVVSYAATTDYINLKDVIRVINQSSNKKVITNLDFSNGSEGCLEGTIQVTDYFALGTKKEYVRQNLPEYASGLYDLFKLSELVDEDL